MTVFGNPSPQIIARWGTPYPEVTRSRMPAEEDAIEGKTYEGEFRIDAPRPPTPGEAYVALSNSVYHFEKEHPEAKVRYVEVIRGSEPRLRFQFTILHASPFPIAILIFGIAVIVGASLTATMASAVLVTVLFTFFLIAIYDYFVGPPPVPITCPKCPGSEFGSIEEWRIHWRVKHPDQEEPDWEEMEKQRKEEEERHRRFENIIKTAAYVGIGLVGTYAVLKYVLPEISRRKE